MLVKELFDIGEALSYEDAMKSLKGGDTIYIKENKRLYKIIKNEGLFFCHEEDEASLGYKICFDSLAILGGMSKKNYFFKVKGNLQSTLLFIQQCQESYRNFKPI